MARKHVAKHLKRIEAHRQRHRRGVYKVLKKMAKHQGCYSGGMMLMGAGVRKRGGMMLMGAGVRKRGHKKKVIKAPAWTRKSVPKTGWPKVPKGFTKKASGWFSRAKAAARAKAAQIKAKGAQLLAHAQRVGTSVAGSVLSNLGAKGDSIVGQVGSLVDQHIDKLGVSAQGYLNAQVNKGAMKVSSRVASLGGKGTYTPSAQYK
jgi:hypothetical protein